MYILTSGIASSQQRRRSKCVCGAHEFYFRDFLSFSLVSGGSHPLGRPLEMLSGLLVSHSAPSEFLHCIRLGGSSWLTLYEAAAGWSILVSNRQEKSPEMLSARAGHIEWCEAPFDSSNNSRTSCPLPRLNHLFECFPECHRFFFLLVLYTRTLRRAVTCSERDRRC
jgi:hypothetical protein